MSDERDRDRVRFLPIGGSYDPVGDGEAAALGRALVAQIRGEPLTGEQKALVTRMRSRAPEDARAPTPVVEASETLATFERGEGAELRITWRSYKGSTPFLDIRRWERGEGGSMRPTRQGVTVRLREISRLLQVVVQVARRLGDAAGVSEDD